jgi:hypothetical protein
MVLLLYSHHNIGKSKQRAGAPELIRCFCCCSLTKQDGSPAQSNSASAEQSSIKNENIDGLKKDIQTLAMAVKALDKKIGKEHSVF